MTINVQFVLVCLLFLASLTFGIANLFFPEKECAKVEFKSDKKKEKVIKKAKLSGFIFLLVAVAIPIIVSI